MISTPVPLVPLDADHSSGGQPSVLTIINARLPYSDKDLSSKLWRIVCYGRRVQEVSLQIHTSEVPNEQLIDAGGGLVLPSHFNEALEVTGRAKAAFPLDLDDLYSRGARLIRESVQYGVTSMRAHVEVDKIVGFSCLDVAQVLRRNFEKVCDVQIAGKPFFRRIFAQEPLFDAPGDTQPGKNFTLLHEALKRDGINVIGSAPYVEATMEQAKMNIALIMAAAYESGAHVDFHLDYNLEPSLESLIYEVISQAKRVGGWTGANGQTYRRITIGHATRLQLFEEEEWQRLAEAIKDLPITLVGLPHSDLYMQGRGDYEKPLGAPRSTLRVPYLLNKYGIEVAMSVNNVQNAFTPQGSLDPLTLCTLGVALFQTAVPTDIEALLRSVTLTSKLALGVGGSDGRRLFPVLGDPADFVILHGALSTQSAVLHPPFDRTVIHAGVVVSRKRSSTWLLGDKHDGIII
ncbi:hypothetical protein C0995_003242 [Termitomyces sp. Mi166|nr:hypothetical protein C0995_003242 [Termitomyces sp. Mi166\